MVFSTAGYLTNLLNKLGFTEIMYKEFNCEWLLQGSERHKKIPIFMDLKVFMKRKYEFVAWISHT